MKTPGPPHDVGFNGHTTDALLDRLSIEFHLDTVKALIAPISELTTIGPTPFWDKEALKWVKQGRCQLGFEQLPTVDSHQHI